MTQDFFLHRFEAGTDPAAPLLLLLHGTGGDENDLVALGRQLAPTAPLLSPRGPVLENGMPRFFRRLAEGVFDEEDIRRRAAELAAWIPVAAAYHKAASPAVIAVGFSNGANIAAAILLLHPGVLRGAVLLRAMVPLQPRAEPRLAGTDVLLVSGSTDPIVPLANARMLSARLRAAGANVTHRELPVGHQITRGDVALAKTWLEGLAASHERE